MWKPYLIGVAAASILAILVAMAGLGARPAGALDASGALPLAAPAARVESSPAPALIRGLGWSRPVSAADAEAADGICPMRKVWTDTEDGPRLRWRRICAAD